MMRLRENGYILMGDDSRITLTEQWRGHRAPHLGKA